MWPEDTLNSSLTNPPPPFITWSASFRLIFFCRPLSLCCRGLVANGQVSDDAFLAALALLPLNVHKVKRSPTLAPGPLLCRTLTNGQIAPTLTWIAANTAVSVYWLKVEKHGRCLTKQNRFRTETVLQTLQSTEEEQRPIPASCSRCVFTLPVRLSLRASN